MLLSSDMLLNDMIRPMTNAYQFSDYEKACHLLVQLNDFLLGFGSKFAIEDLPTFENNIVTDIHDRMNPSLYYKNYYEQYARLVLKSVGMYQREVLNKIKMSNMYGGMSVEV